jgi:hypothetical protein
MRHTATAVCAVTCALVALHCTESGEPSQPVSTAREITSPVDTANAADYLVVAPEGFEAAASAFVDYRMENAGDDVGDAAYVRYSTVEGAFDTASWPLQQLLAHAATAWRTPPRYVLLLGDVPCDTAAVSGRWDGMYLDPDSDGTIEYAVGRIPARNANEAVVVLDKIKAWEASAPGNQALFLADDQCQGGSFDGIAHEAAASSVRGVFDSTHAHSELLSLQSLSGGCPWPESLLVRARDSVHAALGGTWSFVCYFGHTGTVQWADEAILTPGDVASTGPSAVYAAVGGQSADITADQLLARDLLFAPGRAAVAYGGWGGECWASTSETFLEELFREFGRDNAASLGQCWATARQTLAPVNLNTLMLLADPALRVK